MVATLSAEAFEAVLKRIRAGSTVDGEVAVWYVFFCASSVGMQLVNKAIAASFQEAGVLSLDNLLMAWQQLAAIALNFTMIYVVGGDVWRMRPVTRAQILRLCIPSVNFVFMLLCSLKALKTVHVATVVVARNLCTPIICGIEVVIFNKRVSGTAMLSLVVVLAGSVVYAYADLTFELQGYMWQAANSVLFIVGQLYEKWAMDKSSDQTALGVSTIKNTLSLPVLGVLILAQGDWRLVGIEKVSVATWALIGCTGVGCCALSICYMTLYKSSSATAVTVGGNFNKCVSIIFGSILFRATLGGMQSVGLIICMCGSLVYSLDRVIFGASDKSD